MPQFHTDTETPWELLAKHLAGEASVSEQEELHRWLVARPSRLRVLTDATRAWERGGSVADVFTEADVDRAWQRFSAAAGLRSKEPIVRPAASLAPAEAPVVPMWGRSQTLMRVAAAVLLLIGTWAIARTFLLSRGQAETVTIAAANERQLTTLPDGSRVWVNRNSTLSYAADFNQSSRVVQLKGEAFFEVKRDHGRPFTVLANDTRTRVLGTSFNVRAYTAEDSVEVAVVTGRVAFTPARPNVAAQDSVVLTPGLRGVIRKNEAVALQKPILDPNFRAWQRQELVFDNQSLGQVAAALTRYYGTPVELSRPELANCRFTGTFRQAQLPQVLRVVSLSANLSVTQSADGYSLDGPGCQ